MTIARYRVTSSRYGTYRDYTSLRAARKACSDEIRDGWVASIIDLTTWSKVK